MKGIPNKYIPIYSDIPINSKHFNIVKVEGYYIDYGKITKSGGLDCLEGQFFTKNCSPKITKSFTIQL